MQTRFGLVLARRAVPAFLLARLRLPLARRARSADNTTLVRKFTLGASQRLEARPVLGVLVTVVATVADSSCWAFYTVMATLVRTPIICIGAARYSGHRLHQRSLCYGQSLR